MKTIIKQAIQVTLTLLFILLVCNVASAVEISDNNTSLQVNATHQSSNILISGKVVKCSDGTPFEGASVSVKKNGTLITSTKTLADGTYTLNFQSVSRDFTVTASYNGHKPSSQEITVKKNSDDGYSGTANFKLGNNDAYVYKGWETNSSHAVTFSDGTTIDGTASNARTSIAAGIKYATGSSGVNTVYLAPGTYNEHGILISKSVNICGANPSTTIIDAQHNGRIFQINAGTVTIQNMTLLNGMASYAGAIYNSGGTLNLIKCTFRSNTGTVSYGSGGAIYNYKCILKVTNCTFEGNSAGYGGGAIYTAAGSACTVSNSTFKGNSAGANGGAIGSNGNLTVTGSNFESNSVTGFQSQGGAIARNDGSCEVHFNRFYGNSANTGSAIFCASAPSGTVNAQYNWWSSNKPDLHSLTYGNVGIDPWIVLTVTPDPATIKKGKNSTITANLLYDNRALSDPGNSAYYHDPANGHVPDGIQVTFSSNDSPSLGTFDPATNETCSGTATTSFTAARAGTAHINATVEGSKVSTSVVIDDVPVAVNDTATTDEDTQLNGNVATNDTASINGPNTWSIVNGPTHGSLDLRTDGTYTYTPSSNYNGQDTFTYKITDGNGDISNIATVTITVNSVNDVPVAVNDTVSTDEDSVLNGNVSSNDIPSGDGGNIWSVVSGPAHGSLDLHADGTYTYTPSSNYNGQDSFIYRITDVDGSFSDATVIITVNSVNDVPVAVDDTVGTDEDSVLNGNVATNDIPSGDGGNVWSVVSGSAHGSLDLHTDGSYTYTPSSNYNGQDSFTYRITDVDGSFSEATVIITVNSVNDVPVAVNDTVITDEDTLLNSSVAGNDILSGDGGNVWSVVSGSAHGLLDLHTDGTYTYTPHSNYNGQDSFTYRITDVDGSFSEATVIITVNSVNDVPVAVDDTVNTDEDAVLNGNVSGNDIPSGDGGNTWSIVSTPIHGKIIMNSDGTYRYTPETNYYGLDSFTYDIKDADGDTSNTGTVNITVNSIPESSIYVLTSVSNKNPAVGEIVTITFKLGNNGPDPAEKVVFTYVIPEGMEFVGMEQEPGYPTPKYNAANRTITWNLGTVPKIDPWLKVKVKVRSTGIFNIKPEASTTTLDPDVSNNIQNATLNAVAQENTSSKTVKAAIKTTKTIILKKTGTTIGLQETGLPFNYLILAILLVISGFKLPKRR